MRYLVVANQTLGGDALMREVRYLADQHEDATFHIVVPATPPTDQTAYDNAQLGRLDGLEDEGRGVDLARRRLREALRRFADAGLEADGEVADPDPVQAVADALEQTACDEVIVSTLPARLSRWLGMDLPSRVRRRFDLPVHHVEAKEEG